MNNAKFFATSATTDCEVTLADGSVEKLPFKKVGAAEWLRFQAAMGSKDPEVMSTGMLRLVMFSLCNQDGSQALTWEQVQTLDQDVSDAMFEAVLRVNRPKKAEAGNV